MTEQIAMLSPDEMTDLRGMVLRKEQPSLDRLRMAVETLRQNRYAAAEQKDTKAKKAAAKKAPLDMSKLIAEAEGE